jgi:hypothetical protein
VHRESGGFYNHEQGCAGVLVIGLGITLAIIGARSQLLGLAVTGLVLQAIGITLTILDGVQASRLRREERERREREGPKP